MQMVAGWLGGTVGSALTRLIKCHGTAPKSRQPAMQQRLEYRIHEKKKKKIHSSSGSGRGRGWGWGWGWGKGQQQLHIVSNISDKGGKCWARCQLVAALAQGGLVLLGRGCQKLFGQSFLYAIVIQFQLQV